MAIVSLVFISLLPWKKDSHSSSLILANLPLALSILNPTCPVSFIGMDPYIQYNEESIAYGGAEFELIDTYAKAYGFTPKLRREPTYDSSTWDARGEGETFIRGPVAKVGFTFYCLNIPPYH